MKLLIVDDDQVTRDLLREIFEREGYEVSVCAGGEAALSEVRQSAFPIVLTDIRMLDIGGFELLSAVKKLPTPPVVILMTAFGNMEGAIRAIQEGAFDYVSKPFKLGELKAVVQRAVLHWESTQQLRQSHQGLSEQAPPLPPKGLIGKSQGIVDVYKTLARATISPSNVLIVGESGTGKELVARAIHEHSSRRKGKFVAVNCGALSENLLESELFGHVRGAFTGAISNKNGLFEEARNGTLFLDEIGDVSSALQVKLLRVLQEGEYRPVGSDEVRFTDARVIAATHRNLETEVVEGRFREDLFYRLKVILIEIPPLRERLEDLPELVSHFLARFSSRMGKPVSHVSSEAMTLLKSYNWPGNVRELEHAIERAVTMTRTTVLYPEDFPAEIRRVATADWESIGEKPQASLEAVERAHILRVLQEAGFNKSKAAEMLGIDRKTLHRKAQRYGIALRVRGPE